LNGAALQIFAEAVSRAGRVPGQAVNKPLPSEPWFRGRPRADTLEIEKASGQRAGGWNSTSAIPCPAGTTKRRTLFPVV
jgi:hypothetical protein